MGVVSDFIYNLQSYEEHSFSSEELFRGTAAPRSSIRKELTRLVSGGHIMNLRKGFYIILSPRYGHFGKLPVTLYVDKLFKYLGKRYYVGFYSAAAYHGAAHQQHQKDYIITSPPHLRKISKGNAQIDFSTRTVWPEKNILKKTSEAGYFNISSPSLTFADLVENQKQLGGMNRIFTILEELSENMEKNDVENLLSWYDNKSVLQRMGYLLEKMTAEKDIQKMFMGFLTKTPFYPVLLSPGKNDKPGSTGNKWKVDVNIEIESDL